MDYATYLLLQISSHVENDVLVKDCVFSLGESNPFEEMDFDELLIWQEICEETCTFPLTLNVSLVMAFEAVFLVTLSYNI